MPADRDAQWPLRGFDLRYLLTVLLLEEGQALRVSDLVARVEGEGFRLRGRGSKVVSDALRWEVRLGRVIRLGRGLYGPGSMPRQTKSRIRKRVERLRSDLVAARRDNVINAFVEEDDVGA